MNLADIDWGGVIGLAGAAFGAVAWYRGAVEKAYASKRDFGHLKNNYKGLSDAVAQVDRTLDTRFDRLDLDIRELKAQLQTVLMQSGGPTLFQTRHTKDDHA